MAGIDFTLISLVSRMLVGAFLLTAGVMKMALGPSDMVRMVMGYRVAPITVARWVARYLPTVEVVVGFLLLVGLMQRLAAIAASVMLLVFMLLTSQAILRGLDASCGCFGVSENGDRIRWRIVIRNLVLFAGAVAVTGQGVSPLSIDRADPSISMAQQLSIGLGLVVAAAAVTEWLRIRRSGTRAPAG